MVRSPNAHGCERRRIDYHDRVQRRSLVPSWRATTAGRGPLGVPRQLGVPTDQQLVAELGVRSPGCGSRRQFKSEQGGMERVSA